MGDDLDGSHAAVTGCVGDSPSPQSCGWRIAQRVRMISRKRRLPLFYWLFSPICPVTCMLDAVFGRFSCRSTGRNSGNPLKTNNMQVVLIFRSALASYRALTTWAQVPERPAIRLILKAMRSFSSGVSATGRSLSFAPCQTSWPLFYDVYAYASWPVLFAPMACRFLQKRLFFFAFDA